MRGPLLGLLALISFAYAGAVTVGNIRYAQQKPEAERTEYDDLALPAGLAITAQRDGKILDYIAVSPPADRVVNEPMRADVSVTVFGSELARFPAAWVNVHVPAKDRARYVQRFRTGMLEYADTRSTQFYLLDVPPDFGIDGDSPRASLWLLPLKEAVGDQAPSALAADAVERGRAYIDRPLSSLRDDPHARAVFASNYAQPVRAFPALAALLVGLAALGSRLFMLWQRHPWPVVASTVSFVLPIVSAAPFLTAAGWSPIVAAVVLGFVMTTAAVCAIEQRVLVPLSPVSRRVHRLVRAFAVPFAVLVIGTGLVVSFASVSVVPWQGLGGADPGAIFVASLVRPAVALLLGGTGTAVLLALFFIVLNARNARARRRRIG
ncbi:MAG: hypothetical protein AAF465_10325 [Pseudomonadota bacterium]